ncbi:hypothetical protein COCC4DRAFT_58207 [Bipolaris maydis ATCC 48331]|uniref:Uncharacterized protein n=2 Tax=Cochliobolus heterostrophus TaxID=5016 RepID=M2UXV7_COCH5|nr:uncharacterized protein COCC4DRAFT_58207 [Bipolaris maydis ATCC 48331]EMD92658.1 hypothetical protein COCHEDRAFT_1213692 [Bipolaris maydis C5]ENI08354.1 hypothetical protein COCC4DRAFT_58207 [Bipolaris maydis ATCC 48331]
MYIPLRWSDGTLPLDLEPSSGRQQWTDAEGVTDDQIPHRNPPSAVSTCELRSPVALSSPTCSRAPAACPSTLAWCTVAIARFKSQPTASSTRLLDLPPYPISRPVAFAGTEIVAGDHEQPDYDRFYYELFAIPG